MTTIDEKWALTREMIGDGRLSVVLPVYNLATSIEANLRETAELFATHGVRTELVPVDDGSADGSADVLRGLATTDDSATVVIRPVVLARNGGKGAALRAGFAASTGVYVMLLDGDLDIHPKQTPWFFDQMQRKNADIVVGSKRHRFSDVQYPWHRRIVSWVYFTLVRLTIGLPVTDTQTGMKLFKRDVLCEALGRMLVKAYAFDLELLAIAHQRGARIAEAPVVIRFGEKFGCLKPQTIKSMANDSLAVFYRLRLLNYYAKAECPKPLPVDPLVSIVIACPNDSWMLRQCLAAIAKQSYQKFEVIVLPDESIDGASAELGEKVRIISTGKIRPAEKRNLGIHEAKGEIVAFIDDDAYPEEHWLEGAIKYFGDETIGAIGGPGVTPADDSYLARIGGRIYDNLLVSGNYRYRYKAGTVRRDVEDYPSCNLFVRTELLRQIGGYRTDFWPGEDTLLCKDIIDAGKRIVYDPWVIVSHHRRPIFGAHLRQLGRYAFHRGYFVKRFPSNSLRLSYFVPSAFLVYVLAWLPTALLLPPSTETLLCVGSLVFLAFLPLYGILALLTTLSRNPLTWLLTAIGVFVSHLWYGVRFLQGLCARRAPCEFIGKDHA